MSLRSLKWAGLSEVPGKLQLNGPKQLSLIPSTDLTLSTGLYCVIESARKLSDWQYGYRGWGGSVMFDSYCQGRVLLGQAAIEWVLTSVDRKKVRRESRSVPRWSPSDTRDDNFFQIRWRIRYQTRMKEDMKEFFWTQLNNWVIGYGDFWIQVWKRVSYNPTHTLSEYSIKLLVLK